MSSSNGRGQDQVPDLELRLVQGLRIVKGSNSNNEVEGILMPFTPYLL